MGNSESQYTLQGSKNHSNTITGAKPKPCSLKIRSIHAKDDKSLHGWGHGSSGAGYKSRSLARRCLSHLKGHQPYASRPGGPTCKVSKGSAYTKHRTGASGNDFQGSNAAFSAENGFPCAGHQRADNRAASRDCNGHLLSCYGRNESTACAPPGEDRRSPRVLIKTLGKLDGCLRVEFHSGGTDSPEAPGAAGGPVQLLRFSPAPGPAAAASPPSPRLCPGAAHARSSQGSSLSSESSWYDAPWGHAAGEAGEAEGPMPPRGAQKPFTQSSSLASLRELCPDAGPRGLSPSGRRLSEGRLGPRASLGSHVAFASALDTPLRAAPGDPGRYASFTLPCRKPRAWAEDAARKDSLKARIRRISDWTGSLSRKKRKLQVSQPCSPPAAEWARAEAAPEPCP